MFKKVAIVGVGLIGGSLGLAIKKHGLAKEVFGICRRSSSLKKALKKKVIDKGFLSLRQIKDADLVILAAPVDTILRLLPQIAKHLKYNSIVMDVSSTKELVEKAAIKFLPHNVSFVGSHPLAGSERRGVEFSKLALFNGTVCILTKNNKTNPATLRTMTNFWLKLGSKVKIMSAKEHDFILSFTSHLPHVVAFSLALTPRKAQLPYTAGGFKDTTRIASSDSEIWSDIFLSNRKNILLSMKVFKARLAKLQSLIAKNDRVGLERFLKLAKSHLENL